MKKVFLIIMISLGLFFLNSCEKPENKICACGVKNPAKNLPWLAEFIKKAKNDTIGCCFGAMWLANCDGQDFFVTDMPLYGSPGSGSLLLKVFNCEGKREYEFIEYESPESFMEAYDYLLTHMKYETVIYAHPDYPLN